MKPYFDSPEKIARLQFHAGEWIGTPFMPNACIMGAGVSCQKLVGALYQSAGFVAGELVPDGPMDWSHAQTESLVEQFMDARRDFSQVTAWQPGDLLGIKIHGCIHHCGVVVCTSGKFIHCLRGRGTIFGNARDATYLQRIKKIWRPML